MKFAMRSAGSGYGATVELDGVDVSRAVSAVDIHAEASEDPPRVVLHIVALASDIEAEAKVRLAPGTDDLLKQLGWTPPAEDPS
jgi:hypothetical protein